MNLFGKKKGDEKQKTVEQKPQEKPKETKHDDLVTTGVDDLIHLLSEFPKLSVDEVSKRLKVDKGVLKSWIEFLVEEKIIGIEYNFTTPFIYLNKPKQDEKTKKVEEQKLNYGVFKKEFVDKAKKNKIPDAEIPKYWKEHLLKRLQLNKDFFYREVKKRNLPQVDRLWETYQKEAINGT